MGHAKLFIAGCGDIGCRVARLALAAGTDVIAQARSGERAGALIDAGAELVIANLDDPENLPLFNLAGAALLYTIPPPGGGIVDTRAGNFLAAVAPSGLPAKIVYLSATSVYGDCGDELVDETRPPCPANHTGQRRLSAEEQFLAWGRSNSVPVVILRVSGIYGPGRIPLHRIHSREPLLNEAEAGYTNRIHSEDLARICLAALERGVDGDVYNVSDGTVSKMNDYFNAITDLLGLERLPQVPLAEARRVMTPLMYGYMTESRKIDNRKMIEKLGISLQYPTLAEGLRASL